MKLIDLEAQYRSIKKPINRALLNTVERGRFILDRKVAKLETRVARVVGTEFAVGVNSGTDALLLSIKALEIGRGDEIITTPFSFIATAEMIANLGAKPVFVDLEPQAYTIDASKIDPAITKRTRAILPVHLYGQMADMKAIMRTAKRHRLYVIEDAAQAIGAAQKIGSRWWTAGSIGDLSCLSFFPTKNLGAYGDAGMVLTNSRGLAEKIKMLRNHGAKGKYHHEFLGYSSRLDELQAAILLAKLPHLARWNRARSRIARNYAQGLADLPLQIPLTALGNTHVFHQYTIRTKYRDQLQRYLEKRGIPVAVHYPLPLHLQPALRYLRYQRGVFPEAERAAKEVLSLPIYPEISREDQQKVITAIRRFFISL